MKKYWFVIFCFIFLFFSNGVSAKSVSDSDLVVRFGNGDKLDLAYNSINSFKINEDKSFYFNEDKYFFNDDYSLINGSIVVNNDSFSMLEDTFTIDKDKMVVTSTNKYVTYMFDVEIDVLKNKTYEFSQEICYKYNGGAEICNIDKGDIANISRDNSFSYYYDFMPFYDESIVFDYIRYKFTFDDGVNDNIVKEIGFNSSEINYKDSFKVLAYPGSYNSYYYSSYMGKQYLNLNNGYVYISIDSFNKLDDPRSYTFIFYVCYGENYSTCKALNENGNVIDTSSSISSSSRWNLKISNYLYENNELKYNSFKLKATYIYKSGNDTYSRKQTTLTNSNEEIYYISESTPYFKGEINGSKITCNYYYTCYVSNSEVTNKALFEDDNDILKVYYLVTNQKIDDSTLINNEIENGSNFTFGEDLEGVYYLYFRVFDVTGVNSSNLSNPYEYLFDKKGPTMGSNNFDDYNSEGVYKNVNISVSYSDDNFTSVSGIYYKIISESEYNSIDKDTIIEANNEYNGSVNIEDYISGDGVYRVCFVAYDYLTNYTDFNKLNDCSKGYYLDVTALTKQEISVSEVSYNYLNRLNLTITIIGIDTNDTFQCGVFNKDVEVNEVMLTSSCLNNVSNELTFLGEGEYKLWVYASDVAGNYSLIELDEVYYLDNLAPRVNYTSNGDPNSYSNDVKINVNAIDLNNISTSSYLFYQGSYENKTFTSFNLDELISYPFNYYGEYKLAIKVCDTLNNCNIHTDNQVYKIDTGEIKLSLIGEEKIVILKFGKYREKGIEISKGINNSKVDLDYSISGSVDTSKEGEYYLTYKAGSGMNEVSVVRTVIVKDSMPYIYALIGTLLVSEVIIFARLFIKKRKNDSI